MLEVCVYKLFTSDRLSWLTRGRNSNEESQSYISTGKIHLSIGSRVYLKREQWEWLPLWILPNTWSHLITKLSRGMAPLSNPKIWAGQKRPSSVKGGSPKIFLFFHKVPLDMIYGGEIVKRGRWALKNGILALGVWSTMQAPCAVEKLWLTMSAPKQEC